MTNRVQCMWADLVGFVPWKIHFLRACLVGLHSIGVLITPLYLICLATTPSFYWVPALNSSLHTPKYKENLDICPLSLSHFSLCKCASPADAKMNATIIWDLLLRDGIQGFFSCYPLLEVHCKAFSFFWPAAAAEVLLARANRQCPYQLFGLRAKYTVFTALSQWSDWLSVCE